MVVVARSGLILGWGLQWWQVGGCVGFGLWWLGLRLWVVVVIVVAVAVAVVTVGVGSDSRFVGSGRNEIENKK